MAKSCSNSDCNHSSPELVRQLQMELRLRNSNDGQAVASTSQPQPSLAGSLEDKIKNALVSARRQTNKRSRDEAAQAQAASGTSSGSSHSLCSPQSPAVPRAKGKNAMKVTIKEEGLSDDQQKGSPMATSSDERHPEKSGQDEPPTSASNQDTAAGGGGAAASPSVGTTTPPPKPKRKRIRKSKKAPTFTVEADIAQFKEKVQELTGQRPPPIQLEALQDRELCVQVQLVRPLVRPEPVRHSASPLQAMEVDPREISMHISSNLVEGPALPSTLDGMEPVLTFDQAIEFQAAVPLDGTILTGSILDYTYGYGNMCPAFLDDFMDQEQLEPEPLFSDDCSNNDFGYHSFSMDVKPPPPSGEQSCSEEEMHMVGSFLNNNC